MRHNKSLYEAVVQLEQLGQLCNRSGSFFREEGNKRSGNENENRSCTGHSLTTGISLGLY